MKRIATLILLFSLAAVTVMGQDIDLQMAVATQALNQNMLMELDMTEAEAGKILALQEQFRLIKEQTALDLNVIKAQIAQKLYYPDAKSNEVNRLLEKASDLRLEQEKAQVEAYLQIRKQIGEENWSKLLLRARAVLRSRQQAQNDIRNDPGSRGSQGSPQPSGPNTR